jgi:hypothetical protein
MIATFAEASGQRAEALRAYQAVRDALRRDGATWGPMVDGTAQGIKRLSP